MQHLDEGTIHSWLDGALSADEAARVEAHVKECAQCQAAVAEARGFIAASSRILTALDNAPRGVIPGTAPKRRIDPMVWRIAATVLVVAAGTLVVVRNSGLNLQTASKEVPVLTSAQAPAPMEGQRDTSTPASAGSVSSEKAPVANSPASVSSGAARDQVSSRPPAAFRAGGGAAAPRESRPKVSGDESQRAAGERRDLTTLESRVGVAPAPALPAPQSRFEAAQGRSANVAAMDAAAEVPALKIVGVPRRAIGQKTTSYEVAPGDTVVLTEVLKVELNAVVTTGMSLAQPAAAGAVKTRATAKAAAAATDTVRTEAARVGAAPPAVVPAFVETPNGINTLTWTDSTTGSGMKLSGRHSREELEEIKRRIERARAAAADSVKRSR